jgi:hypothetical protein
MIKTIVTTTINKPTEALIKFSKMKDWNLVVVGDKKTPHKFYEDNKDIIYLSPSDQEKISKRLSNLIGWNCIQRRNFGFIYAHKMRSDIIATVDDDNIPYKNWGKNLMVKKKIKARVFKANNNVFDPLSVTEHKKQIWHRGFPIEYIKTTKTNYLGKKNVNCIVQADLWDGDPDIDAICRIANSPIVKFKKFVQYTSNNISPFNSQNTFIDGKYIKFYYMFPHIGRMDDIWGSYYFQENIKKNVGHIVYASASVYQSRNQHNLTKDLEGEIFGYKHNSEVLKKGVFKFLPKKSLESYKEYIKLF